MVRFFKYSNQLEALGLRRRLCSSLLFANSYEAIFKERLFLHCVADGFSLLILMMVQVFRVHFVGFLWGCHQLSAVSDL